MKSATNFCVPDGGALVDDYAAVLLEVFDKRGGYAEGQ
jgi:hypothetical protein